MGSFGGRTGPGNGLRTVPNELRERYLAAGWWTDDTLGELVGRCVTASAGVPVHIWSDDAAWHGTYGDVADEARRLVSVLRDNGIEDQLQGYGSLLRDH